MTTGPDEVNKIHDYDDVDVALDSHHHTLGTSQTQAAPGSHGHDAPFIWLRQTVAQSIPTAVWTRVNHDNLTSDPKRGHGYFSYNLSTGQVTVLKEGTYLITANFTCDATAMQYGRIMLNSFAYGGRVSWPGTGVDGMETNQTHIQDLGPGTIIETQQYNTAAAANTKIVLSASEWISPKLQIVRLGDR